MTGHDVVKLIIALKLNQHLYAKNDYWRTYRRLRGLFYRTPEWRGLRARVRKKYKFCSVNPQHKRNLDVHHAVFIYQNPGLALTESNLLVICRRCHKALHALTKLEGRDRPSAHS